MKLLFNLEYQTIFGEQLVLNMIGTDDSIVSHSMTTLDGLHWTADIASTNKSGTYIDYY